MSLTGKKLQSLKDADIAIYIQHSTGWSIDQTLSAIEKEGLSNMTFITGDLAYGIGDSTAPETAVVDLRNMKVLKTSNGNNPITPSQAISMCK